MLIDWFTVVAQALNFVILAWLLKRFLYKPILDAIDAREKHIADELADAATERTAAQKEHDDFQSKNAEFDRQRAALIDKARREAQAERQRLFNDAREAADALSAQRLATFDKDARKLNQAIRARTRHEVIAIARKTLTDLAGIDLEQRVCEVFCTHLRALAGDDKDVLAEAIGTALNPAVVRSAFELPSAQQIAIREAVHDTFATDIELRFEAKPDLIAGIELSVNGQNVAWGIADHLEALEQGIEDVLQAHAAPANTPKATHDTTPTATAHTGTAPAGSVATGS